MNESKFGEFEHPRIIFKDGVKVVATKGKLRARLWELLPVVSDPSELEDGEFNTHRLSRILGVTQNSLHTYIGRMAKQARSLGFEFVETVVPIEVAGKIKDAKSYGLIRRESLKDPLALLDPAYAASLRALQVVFDDTLSLEDRREVYIRVKSTPASLKAAKIAESFVKMEERHKSGRATPIESNLLDNLKSYLESHPELIEEDAWISYVQHKLEGFDLEEDSSSGTRKSFTKPLDQMDAYRVAFMLFDRGGLLHNAGIITDERVFIKVLNLIKEDPDRDIVDYARVVNMRHQSFREVVARSRVDSDSFARVLTREPNGETRALLKLIRGLSADQLKIVEAKLFS